MSTRRLVLATGNRGKAAEIQAMLGSAWTVVLQSELDVESIEETGATFTENALLKARHAAAVTGLPALADDSGLEVDALNGAPGVHSARYAGPGATDSENVAKLLSALSGTPTAARSARFRCVLAYVRNAEDPQPLLASGTWEGRIAAAPRGSGGFGYDPIFEDALSDATSAELPATVKNERSHRGQALRALQRLLTFGTASP